MGESNGDRSHLKDTMDQVMLAHPEHWSKYYSGTRDQQSFKRRYSFSDRSRYYWPDRSINSARLKLIDNLRKNSIPLSLLSQFMPGQFYKVLSGGLANDPMELVLDHIRIVCGMYARACRLSKD
jgi:D-tagatose-1,6-bisphosphate aldolase subunit GatZ/KbaZ